eukprot:8148921-Alexandrium_andersonii.AAC.1
MSASLVGSEMCIRDRLWHLGCPLRQSLPHPCSTQSSVCTRRRSQRASAVSYTHLTLPTICSV